MLRWQKKRWQVVTYWDGSQSNRQNQHNPPYRQKFLLYLFDCLFYGPLGTWGKIPMQTSYQAMSTEIGWTINPKPKASNSIVHGCWARMRTLPKILPQGVFVPIGCLLHEKVTQKYIFTSDKLNSESRIGDNSKIYRDVPPTASFSAQNLGFSKSLLSRGWKSESATFQYTICRKKKPSRVMDELLETKAGCSQSRDEEAKMMIVRLLRVLFTRFQRLKCSRRFPSH